jgi:hypothetical protein
MEEVANGVLVVNSTCSAIFVSGVIVADVDVSTRVVILLVD